MVFAAEGLETENVRRHGAHLPNIEKYLSTWLHLSRDQLNVSGWAGEGVLEQVSIREKACHLPQNAWVWFSDRQCDSVERAFGSSQAQDSPDAGRLYTNRKTVTYAAPLGAP